jgi:hypothetical protein
MKLCCINMISCDQDANLRIDETTDHWKQDQDKQGKSHITTNCPQTNIDYMRTRGQAAPRAARALTQCLGPKKTPINNL